MNQFIDYLTKENQLAKILEYYNVDQENWEIERYFRNLTERLDESEVNEFKRDEHILLDLDRDILGSVYEEILENQERKALGQFYTPKSIVSYILETIGYSASNNIENKRLIDLSCGAGNFITQAIKEIIKKNLKILNRKNISDLNVDECKSLISRIKDLIQGVDINPIACVLCQINIDYILFGIFKLIREEDVKYEIPIFNIKNIDALALIEFDQYDYVVGNPPYVFIRDIPNDQRKIINNLNFITTVGQYDFYQIFIELGIRLLKNHGKLGYIVPDSLLALSNRSVIRKYIYNTTKVIEIYNVGPQFEAPIVSNIILILEKESKNREREKNSIKIKLLDKSQKEILQERLKDWDFKFLIHLDEGDVSVINHLNNNFQKLRDLIKGDFFNISLSRGIELTKTGEVIYCSLCKKFFPIPKGRLECPDCECSLEQENIEKIIVDAVPERDRNKFKLFLFGIKRYHSKEYRYVDVSKNGINYKNPKNYVDRIVIRQLNQNNLICATYEKSLSFTSQSLYNLKIHKSPITEFNNFYLLGIINSLLISYYFIKSFGSYKKLFPRILIEKVQDFPIKIPENMREKEIASKIIQNVKKMLTYEEEHDNEKFRITQKELDDLVFRLYNINELDKQHILDYMGSF
ncbi:MAG: N-6 DNA methylase [Promethearchaeota archaeon]|jgi:tRNA1(Val) A37 N6-methylase TrmN6